MNVTAKVFAGALCAGGVSLTGCYVGGVWSDIPCVSLSEEEEGKGTSKWNEYDNKIGKSYGIYLSAVYGKDNANERWWKKSFEKYQEDESKNKVESSHFSSVGFAYAALGVNPKDSEKFLNKVCEEAYKKGSETTVVNFGEGSEDKYKLGRDLIKYCSPLGEVPKKLSLRANFATEYKSGIGHEKKEELADFDGNDAFWGIKQKQFYGDKETALKDNEFFKEYVESSTPIRKICEKAYLLAKTDSGNAQKDKPKEDEIVKYCSFKSLP